MVKNNSSSIKKLNEQINKFSKKKEYTDKTPMISKKDLVRKVKAKQIDERIEKNKKKYPYKKKTNNTVTKKINTIKDNIIVDEDYISFNDKLNSKDIKDLEDRLRNIYSKEVLSSDLHNNDNKNKKDNFFKNDFLKKINNKISSAGEKIINEAVDLSEKNIDSNIEFVKKWDVLSIITLGIFILFVLCVVAFFMFILWILNY